MKVKIYSTPGCPWCQKAKEFCSDHNVKFEDIDVANDTDAAEEMIKKSGQRGVPVIEAGGKVIVGFDEGALKEALKL
jgi:glutaredoxin 3